jgi:hypothetical protein
MNKEQKALKERIKAARDKPSGFNYMPPNWPKKFWSMSSSEIADHITNRFEETDDEIEYYTCLVYMYNNTTKFNKLLVEWKDSTNYQRFLRLLHEEDKKIEKVNKNSVISKKKNKDPIKRDNKRSNTIKESSIKTKVVPKKLSSVSITNNFI